jgi:hypothetical protein
MFGIIHQAFEHFEADADAIGRRVVVEHDRQRGGLGDRTEVRDQLFDGRHIDHRRQQHQRIDADLLGIAGIFDCAVGGELGHAGDQRYAPANGFDGALEHRTLLIGFERIIFAAGAKKDEPIHPIIDQRTLHFLGRVCINRKIFGKLGSGGRVNALPQGKRCGHSGRPPVECDIVYCIRINDANKIRAEINQIRIVPQKRHRYRRRDSGAGGRVPPAKTLHCNNVNRPCLNATWRIVGQCRPYRDRAG